MQVKYSGGYLGKLLRVDLGSKSAKIEPIDPRRFQLLLGGRGVAAKYYYDEIPASVGPLEAANKLFFFTGPLTGLPLPSTTKFQLATRSPETRRYLCSNCGGDFGPRLKMAGFDALIVEGQAADWTYLTIKDGKVAFGDARPWQGYSSTRTLEELKAAMGGGKLGAMSIGPAGERLVRLSYINVDSRAFGRGGPGAVMGSKRLKGIAVSGSGKIPLADPVRAAAIQKAAVADLKTSRANHTKFGTPQYLEVINELGCMPTRNFQTAHFEGMSKIDAHVMYEHYLEKNYACFHCSVACGKTCVVREGPYAGARARTEFESIGLLGPNCGIDDYAAIIKANQLCDELGLDTISAGCAVGLAMELFERGLITSADTGGLEARFGNARGAARPDRADRGAEGHRRPAGRRHDRGAGGPPGVEPLHPGREGHAPRRLRPARLPRQRPDLRHLQPRGLPQRGGLDHPRRAAERQVRPLRPQGEGAAGQGPAGQSGLRGQPGHVHRGAGGGGFQRRPQGGHHEGRHRLRLHAGADGDRGAHLQPGAGDPEPGRGAPQG